MPRRQRKVRQNVLAVRLWEEIARDKNAGYLTRVFCINAIAVATGMIEMNLVLPGTPRKPIGRPEIGQAPQVDEAPEELDDNAEAKRMLEELNAANPQSDRSPN